jgi:pimeloyl-ACP methyl ester carboxylesterase
VRELGSDRTIVFIAGVGGSASEWDAVRPLLGRLAPVAATIPVDGSLVLIGHSEGGVRAIRIAAAQPGRVDAVVLASGFFPPARAGRSLPAAVLDYGRHRLFYLRDLAARGRRPSPSRRGIGQMASVARLGLRPAAFHRLADAVRCPVLVLHGAQDHIVPIAFARAAAAAHPSWTFRELHGIGHHPHSDQPAEFATAAAEWLGMVL